MKTLHVNAHFADFVPSILGCMYLVLQAMFLNVLFKSLKSDPSMNRVKVLRNTL